jgi:hypothetical protein
MQNEISRREFLGRSAAAGGVFAMGGLNLATLAAPGAVTWPMPAPARIHVVFAGRTADAYLTRPTEELARFGQQFKELEQKLGHVRFLGHDEIPPANADELALKLKEADALLIIHTSGHGGDAPELSKLVDVGLPTAVFSQPFSGHGWMYFPQWRKQGKRVVLMPSSDWSELERAARLLRVPAAMKQTRILVVGRPNGTASACSVEKVRAKFGSEMVIIPNERILEEMKAVALAEAEAEAERYWIKPAVRIVEPSREEIVESARMYLATRKLMIEERAQAICSVHCMGNPRGCLTYSKLNDLGLVGACEGDIDSTLTMLIFAYAFGVPGFISDPVIDTARNAMVHFHCTSATRMDGPAGARLPFTIRTQTDSRGGVALEVTNRVGQPVTCAKLVDLDTMLVVPGEIIETSNSPLACRTQFAQSVPDARRLFLNWGEDVTHGDTMTLLHRVVFYGDYMRAMQDLGDLMGFKVIEEGGVAQA